MTDDLSPPTRAITSTFNRVHTSADGAHVTMLVLCALLTDKTRCPTTRNRFPEQDFSGIQCNGLAMGNN